MKPAIGIICIVLPVVLALWPDIKAAVEKKLIDYLREVNRLKAKLKYNK